MNESDIQDELLKTEIGRECYNWMVREGWVFCLFDGAGAFSDPATKVIRVGHAQGLEDAVGHIAYHVGCNVTPREVVSVSTLKQITDYSKFTDLQVATHMTNVVKGCNFRNRYFREIGHKEVSPEEEIYRRAPWGGYRSLFHYFRCNNSKEALISFIARLPEDSMVALA